MFPSSKAWKTIKLSNHSFESFHFRLQELKHANETNGILLQSAFSQFIEGYEVYFN